MVIVRGDILSVSPGDVVPADCAVLESSNLSISQSSLTGEAEPQLKTVGSCDERAGKTAIFDLQNVLFSGTDVILAADWFVTYDQILVLKGVKTTHWQQAAIFALSTAATLVPEMLPAVDTANLSRGSFLLRKNGVVVNHMDTIHSLGSMSVLCSDKTGTLTKDEIELCDCLDPLGEENPEVLQLALTDACSQSGTKHAIDSAIINHITEEKEVSTLGPRIGEIPFSFEARRSSCIIRTATGSLKLICKGAFEEVMALCSHIRKGGLVHRLDEQNCLDLTRRVQDFNAQAYRVVLVASRDIQDADIDDKTQAFDGLDNQMTIEGFLTFLDPLKEDAKESVTHLQLLGVDVRILTGDNRGVAMSVARRLGLAQELDEEAPLAISGPKLAEIEDQNEWLDIVKHCKIFAKLTPAQKGQVVEALQAQDEVVGMIGDGINDSIALSAADVGISVNTGSNVAKHSADLILMEKKLSKIVDAVMIGRKTHGNIMKYMKMILAANFGNIVSVVIASVWFLFDLILPV
ncbi:hypothetical protein IFR05_004031 [Cadophora sp. M221]|nr:hypothetical protein IFR05_004031 [Cadophora sp. M221]